MELQFSNNHFGLVDVRERAHLYDGGTEFVRGLSIASTPAAALKRHISTMLASNCPSFAIVRTQNLGDMLQIKKKIYFDTEP